MGSETDLLYSIFEQHLFNALVEEETDDEFLSRVVGDFITRLSQNGGVITREHLPTVESDLREEVLEMLRKKIYGHYNLAAFRKARGIVPPAAEPNSKESSRRSRRAS